MTPGERAKERIRQQKLRAAEELFKHARGFPGVRFRIYEAEKQLVENRTAEEAELRSEPRLQHLLKVVDIRGEAYSELISSQSLQDAFEIFMEELVRWAFHEYSGLPITMLLPLHPAAKEPPLHVVAKTIMRRAQQWTMEGYRRLDLLQKDEGKSAEHTRRGYRAEVAAWMKRIGLDSQRRAARRLGVSIDVLKSIMSEKGRARYSEDTLAMVLKKITQDQGVTKGD